jgi:predicted phage terminase large subunit-like protein
MTPQQQAFLNSPAGQAAIGAGGHTIDATALGGGLSKSAERSLMQLLADAAAREEQVLRPARDNLFDFTKFIKPHLMMAQFQRALCDALDQFYDDVMAGLHPRLMIFAPPRHGKSETASRCFPAYCFGKNPRLNFIACSYAAMLAGSMNRDVQRIMDGEAYAELFPESRLGTENVATLSGKPLRNSDVFEIMGYLGRYRSAGVGGGITGQGFDIGLIDDPIADAASALSETIRESIWEWYRTTFYTRRSPHSGIVLIMTRWHQDDLAGRLLQEMKDGGEKWTVVSFPAIAEADEQWRKVGDALHPERIPLEMLRATERTLGSYNWTALYQQRPSPAGGNIFNRNKWQFWKVLPTLEEIILSVDCTFKDSDGTDYVAIQVWGRKGADKYLLKRRRERLGFTATVTAVRAMRALYPTCGAVLIEDKANGSAVIDTIKKEIAGVIAVTPEGGKVARGYAVQPEQEAGNLYLPDPSIDETIENFLDEATNFPLGTHDDEVDAMTQAVNWMRNRESTLGMLDFLRTEAERVEAERRKAA